MPYRFLNSDRVLRQRHYYEGIAIDDQKLQSFSLIVKNVAGTLSHAFAADSDPTTWRMPVSRWVDRISGVQNVGVATPTLNTTTDFTGGGGFAAQGSTTDAFVFNTGPQTLETQILMAEIEHYSGNNVRSRVQPVLNKRDVNGRNIIRPELWWQNDLDSAALNFNTTRLPSGTLIIFRILMALR